LLAVKYPYTDYGKKVALRLLDMGTNQAWLIREIRTHCTYCVDSSNLHKILTGQLKRSRLIPIINDILFSNEKHCEGSTQ